VTERSEDAQGQQLGRAWWQRLPFVLLVGVLPVPFGLYFLGFIAMALLLSDRTRDTEVRAGGAVALFWWAYAFRQGDTTPYVAAPLLVTAAALFAVSAWKRRTERTGPVWLPAVAAVVLLGFAVAAFVPYGYRPRDVTRDAAVRAVVAERTAHPWKGIAATAYLAEGGRTRFVHTPLWFVVLYEPNATVARTADNEPCYARREVWKVNALDGAVSRVTSDEASAGGDPCLPVRQGTGKDVRPLS
jgi:hypothetical protein